MCFIKKQERNVVSPFFALCNTDLHSHILPCIDDGSSSVEESLELLRLSAEQGVKRIVATPHFYPHKSNVDEFLAKRNQSLDLLKEALKGEEGAYPDIYIGAEVLYFSGISRSESIEKLCIEGTRLVLVEMPFGRWNSKMLEELFDIKRYLDVMPVVAHIDRYLRLQSKDTIESLFDREVLIQANADSFIDPATQKKVLKMLMQDKIDFLGSDCHNFYKRPQNLSAACEIIHKKKGIQAFNKINDFTDFVFDGIEGAI